ncbi:MAG: hypothetical protein Q8P53_01140 [Candidatus Shapirobacteria bacterium]|nr:hypothetical protein [Candidatus Shapirobacteria bacterium]
MPPITPDLSANIISTLYLLFSHNYIVFAYFTGLVISIFLSLYRPSRYATLLLLGFALLTFSYEYDKHIVDGLRDQTLTSLITAKPHYTVQRWINIAVGEILPIFFYTLGWFLIFLALIKKSKN